ncbi:nucleotidyltransferase domain-containing protein, partial [Streptococcus thoraltensis]
MKNNNVTEKDLFYILELFEHMKVTYWLDGGWGVDVLNGKQQREHRDIDIDFDAQNTQKIIQKLENIGKKIKVEWITSRKEKKNEKVYYKQI